nr:GDSL-type esterase/lipase family protein [uncultured Acetatifactor sp.]
MIKWLKKWSYMIMLVGTGVVYLTSVDNWQVYAKPLMRIQSWYADSGLGNLFSADGGITEGGGSENSAGGQEGAAAGEDTGTGSGAGESGTVSGTGDAQDSDPAQNPGEGPSVVGEEGGSGLPEGEPASSANEGNGLPLEGETGEGTGASDENGEGTEASAGGVPGEPSESGEPVYMVVEDDYFSDAVFIGDSRTVGMFEYGGLEETASFYASTGLTVYKMFDSEIVSVPSEKRKISVEEALQQNTFAKIYLMIGINEMGTGTVESFLEAYQGAVAHLRELQPDAIIYLQGIIRVTSERSAQGDYINNEGINARNEGIAQLADNETIFYLDVNPLICDETGGMIPDYTFDGVHLKAKYIEIWKDYLKSHAISS